MRVRIDPETHTLTLHETLPSSRPGERPGGYEITMDFWQTIGRAATLMELSKQIEPPRPAGKTYAPVTER